jgi:hypothetical protein
MKTNTSSLMDGKDYKQNKVMRIDDINEIAAEQIKQNTMLTISDKVLFEQATVAMEEHYGYGCETEIDAYFRGLKWMQKQFNKQD